MSERERPGRERPRSYYGRPVVKPPVWTWEIPFYFFTGGLAGASAGLAYGAELTGNRGLARPAWALALGGVTLSPALLISDLGRPGRFFNMLRVFKPTSPMNLGSWLLTASGAAIAAAAARAWLGFPLRIGAAAQPLAAGLGMPLASYTAVLVSNTSVPVWSEARRLLPVSFASSAAASAGAAATLLAPPEVTTPARRLAIGGALAETLATEAMKRRLGELGSPYKRGAAGWLARAASALTLGGAALLASSARRSRNRAGARAGAAGAGGMAGAAGAAMILAGSLAMRWSVFRAGFESAAEPEHTVGPQRRRLAEREGA